MFTRSKYHTYGLQTIYLRGGNSILTMAVANFSLFTLHSSLLEEVVYEVDFAALLLFGGVQLQQGRDGDGRGALPERLLHDELGGIIPCLEGLAVRVGVGEERDTMAPQGSELVGLDIAQATSGEPHMLREMLAEDDCRLLRLYHCNNIFQPRIERITRILLGVYSGSKFFTLHSTLFTSKEVQSEEAVPGGHALRICPAVSPLQQGADPCRMPLLVAMAVLAVVHHLAVADVTIGIYLPKDDAALAGTAQPVVTGGTLHLLLREVAGTDHGTAEQAFGRQRPAPQRGDNDQTALKYLDLQVQLAA